MWLRAYQYASVAADPFLRLWLRHRQQRGKEDPARLRERFGYAGRSRPAGPLVWFHAASVGESLAVLPLIEKILERYPDENILITSGTVTSAELLQERLPQQAFHQYIPIDSLGAVRRFLKHWRPILSVWVESELWPNLVTETRRLGHPMVLVNARISKHSYDQWRHARGLISRMLRCFSLILAQGEKDATRFRHLGAESVIVSGNLKYAANPLPADSRETSRLLERIGDRQVWVAASTHSGEERIIAEAHRLIRTQHKDVLTIIVPRHPRRGREIAAELKDNDFKVARRAQDEAVTGETEIYIADTLGELGLFYRVGCVVFVGGSLIQHGGQNPLEAARLECAIISGPYTDNFQEIYKALREVNGVVTVQNAEELGKTVSGLLSDTAKQEALVQCAGEIVREKSQMLEMIVNQLEPYLSQNQKAPPAPSVS